MTDKYILEGKIPVAVSSLIDWAEWFETADRTVKKTQVGTTEVSTIFLGFPPHQHGNGGPPLLFETMIFGGKCDEHRWRYSTWEEAEAGHDRVVTELLEEAR